MNPGFNSLQPYPFERLAALRKDLTPNAELTPINLSIGEPQHPTPRFIHEALINALAGTARYPATKGSDELRTALAGWLTRRFRLPATAVDAERMVLPVNGTREALFAIAQALVPRRADRDLVLMPNPFYQIYEGAALLAGATPYFLPCPASNAFLPDVATVRPEILRRCTLMYLCSPSNPAGSILTRAQLQEWMELAVRYDFTLVADECYSELYFDEVSPPPGLLEAAWLAGNHTFKHCLIMHSLSKRSSAPGLRSGFVAGDAQLIDAFFKYRTYHGSAMPLHVQAASIAAWNDETHVIENRRLYRAKLQKVAEVLGTSLSLSIPAGGFYFWPEVPLDDLEMCRRLIANANVTTLPGQFLARTVDGENPGVRRLRLALVAELAECVEAATRIKNVISRL